MKTTPVLTDKAKQQTNAYIYIYRERERERIYSFYMHFIFILKLKSILLSLFIVCNKISCGSISCPNREKDKLIINRSLLILLYITIS